MESGLGSIVDILGVSDIIWSLDELNLVGSRT